MSPQLQSSTTRGYVLVTAAYNEERHIERTIQSVIAQTILPLKWVIVSDGSTDRTDEIVLRYSKDHSFITLSRITDEHPRNCAAQVMAINHGFTLLKDLDFEFIGNIDADISFASTYYETLLERFACDVELGCAGGFICEENRGVFTDRPGNSTSSVAHAVQLFRKSCFDVAGPYQVLEFGGPDWVAEVRARQFGWKVVSFQDLKVNHFRPTASAGGVMRGRLRQGRMDHAMGSLVLFECLKCLRRFNESPRLWGALLRFCGFMIAYLRGEPRLVPDDFVAFLRQEQLQRLRALVGLRSTTHSLDSFRA
jgi:glycosyltransferase involved in cell wall biosynthesis